MKKYREIEIYYGYQEGNLKVWDTYIAYVDPRILEENYLFNAELQLKKEYPNIKYSFIGIYHIGDIVELNESHTTEEVIDELVDNDDYHDHVREIIDSYFKQHPRILQSWKDWFDGKSDN